MRRVSRKLSIILASMAALAAFAVPSAASAAVWGPVGTTQSLDAVPTYTVSEGLGSWSCKEHVVVGVRNPASSTLDIKSVGWSLCTGTGTFGGCFIQPRAEKLPWTVSGSLTNSVVNVGQVAVTVSGLCVLGGTEFHYSGALAGGVWNATGHSLTYKEASGLSVTEFPYTISVTGTWADPNKVLTLS